MTDWVEVTQSWIDRWSVKDSSERPHYPHGIWTSKAFLTAYVCFDDHPVIGREVTYLFTEVLKQHLLARQDEPPMMATLNGDSRVTDTGAGYCVLIKKDFIESVAYIGDQPSDDPDRAVNLVMGQLSFRGFKCRKAALSEQRDGVDIMAVDPQRRWGLDIVPIETKSRRKHQVFDRIFVQISETNPERLK